MRVVGTHWGSCLTEWLKPKCWEEYTSIRYRWDTDRPKRKTFHNLKSDQGLLVPFCITAFVKENKNIKSKLHSQARTCCGSLWRWHYDLINFLLSSRVFSFSSLSRRTSLSRPFFCWDPYLKQTNKTNKQNKQTKQTNKQNKQINKQKQTKQTNKTNKQTKQTNK